MPGLFDKLLLFVVVGFLSYAIYEGYENSGMTADSFKDQVVDDPGGVGLGLIAYSEGVAITTPSFQREWVPWSDPEKRIYMLEDLPFLDSMDIIPVAIAILLSMLLSKLNYFNSQINGMKATFALVFLYISMIVVFLIIWKILWFYLMIWGGKQLGMTAEQVIQSRYDVLVTTGDYAKPLFALSILGFFGLLKNIFFSGKSE